MKVADIGDPREERRCSRRHQHLGETTSYLFVDTFMDGKVRVFDVTEPAQAEA